MSTNATQPTQPQLDNATLIEKVAYPVFFQKMASCGFNPQSEKAAVDLANLANRVVPAVDAFVRREVEAQKAAADSVIGLALQGAQAIAGVRQPEPPAAQPDGFINDPSVKAAAERLALEQLKASGLADMVGMGKSKEEEEEEEEAKKKAPAAMPAAC